MTELKLLNFSGQEFLNLCIFLFTVGAITTMFQIAGNSHLTPDFVFEQAWVVCVTYLITIGIFFLIGKTYNHFSQEVLD